MQLNSFQQNDQRSVEPNWQSDSSKHCLPCQLKHQGSMDSGFDVPQRSFLLKNTIHTTYPYHPRMVYLPTFGWFFGKCRQIYHAWMVWIMLNCAVFVLISWDEPSSHQITQTCFVGRCFDEVTLAGHNKLQHVEVNKPWSHQKLSNERGSMRVWDICWW